MKSMLNLRKFVPEYYAKSRDFQVFLREAELLLSVVKSDTDNYIQNLLDPMMCKSRLLPLLANYVGYNYNPRERVLTNRWITKLFPTLIHNRGNQLGIELAIAAAVCLMYDEGNIHLDSNFSLEYSTDVNKYKNIISVLNVHLYQQNYLSILNELIEIVRPAGYYVKYIPSVNMSSSETINLTDAQILARYDYTTGRLLSINGIDILTEDRLPVLADPEVISKYNWDDMKSWFWNNDSDISARDKTWNFFKGKDDEEDNFAIPGLFNYSVPNKNENKANHYNLMDLTVKNGKFYDNYDNYIGRQINFSNGIIVDDNDNSVGLYVKNSRIYATQDGQDVYTGLYFDFTDVSHILNGYYKIMEDGVYNLFLVNADNGKIYDSRTGLSKYRLVDELIDTGEKQITGLRLIDDNGEKYNWYLDRDSRRFKRLSEGQMLPDYYKIPFTDTSYVGKKAYIINIDDDGTMLPTNFYVNAYGDILDSANNIILSKQDRYKISDSTMIGFSEIFNNRKIPTHFGTNIQGRDWSFIKDKHLENELKRKLASFRTDAETLDDDPRYKIKSTSFNVSECVREYTGHNDIMFLANSDLEKIIPRDGKYEIMLHDEENEHIGILTIDTDINNVYPLSEIFKNISVYFEDSIPNNSVNPSWNVYVKVNINSKGNGLFNTDDLDQTLVFTEKGLITKRKLKWIKESNKHVRSKIYDGTTTVFKD